MRCTRITGRHRQSWTWQSILRQKIAPAASVAVVLLILSYALSGLIARADTGSDYGHLNAHAICTSIDAQPTVAGVRATLARVIRVSGLSQYDAGHAVGTAVRQHCLYHLPLLQEYARQTQQGTPA